MENKYPEQFTAFLDRNYPAQPVLVGATSGLDAPASNLAMAASGQTPKTSRGKQPEQQVAEVPTGNPLSYCRLCFSSHITRRIKVRESVENWIDYIAQNAGIHMDIEEDPCFAICFGCTAALESVDQFRASCQRHDMALKLHRATLVTEEVKEVVAPPQAGGLVISNVMTLAPEPIVIKVVQPDPVPVEPPPPPPPPPPPSEEPAQLLVEEPPPLKAKWTINCHACDIEIEFGMAYTKHMKKFHRKGGKFLQCPMCEKRFRKNELFQAHVQQHKTPNARLYGNMVRRCRVCKDSFPSTTELNDHQLNQHGMKFLCRVCNTRFASVQEKSVHKLLHKAGLPKRVFQCKICKRVFRNGHRLNNHINLHNRYFVCPICGKPCNGMEQYVEHQSNQHQNSSALSQCVPCRLTFQNYAEMRVHLVAKHTGYDPKAVDDDEDDDSESSDDGVSKSHQQQLAVVETVSLSDDDAQEEPQPTEDDLFPVYLDEGGEPEDGTSGTGNALVDDDLVLEDTPQLDSGFDLYGTAFPQQITITLDDDSG
ncbi:zinc finger protein 827 [Aedes aegypti]|uniref:Uncharacterized protein n=2 Tax=Aedes aegypti TaxID=7159 RepID=A0A6I8TAC5_AEDAE|nr:zinc finger protein 827 [Aedes aegypti]